MLQYIIDTFTEILGHILFHSLKKVAEFELEKFWYAMRPKILC